MTLLMWVKCIGLIVFLTAGFTLQAQECPKDNPNGPSSNSASRKLTGKVIYHDEIRQWFELVLDSETCGQKSIQLLSADDDKQDVKAVRSVEVFRDCHVAVEGTLGIPSTGYYSAEVYIDANSIIPKDGCSLQPQFPDYSKVKPDRAVRAYRVAMKLDYTGRRTIAISARSGKTPLKPWQGYASYMLTGGFAFYGYCAEGFQMTRLRGTPEAKPWMINNHAAMDPESAAVKHIRWVTMEFTCRREPGASGIRSDQ